MIDLTNAVPINVVAGSSNTVDYDQIEAVLGRFDVKANAAHIDLEMSASGDATVAPLAGSLQLKIGVAKAYYKPPHVPNMVKTINLTAGQITAIGPIADLSLTGIEALLVSAGLIAGSVA